MCVACSAEPTVAPTIGAKPVSGTPDPKLIKMADAARIYLKNLNEGKAGASLSAADRSERIKRVSEFVEVATAAIATPQRARLRVAPAGANLNELADVVPLDEEEGESSGESLSSYVWPIFVESGTFTDLCLSCQNATGFMQTNYFGLLTSSTQATINVGGLTYNPSSGNASCFGANCLSQIDLAPIVDCHARPASGTASSTATFFVKLKLMNISLGSMNTYDTDECVPPVTPTVTLGSSSISVGVSTQATSSCVTSVQWSSGNAAVASVDVYGVVTGRGAGTAEISAYCNGMRGSATIEVHFAEQTPTGDSCDDPMTPDTETCETGTTQPADRYSRTYTRPGNPGEADPLWFNAKYALVYKVVCDVTDWYQWNADHTAAYYVGTDINSCWLEPQFSY
jgi:hypothetical protein